MPTLPTLLPFSLSREAGSSATFTADDVQWDVAIGGVPFNRADSPERLFERNTAPFRKQQIDQSSEAGEQTLTGWWYRSQLSFHSGAGQLYGDPSRDDQTTSTRFHSSVGVDPWTAGELTLLNRMTSPVTQQCDSSAGYRSGSTDCALYTGTLAAVIAYDGSSVTSSTAAWGFTAPTSVASDGSTLYAGSSAGIHTSPVAATAGGLVWTNTWNTTGHVTLAWVKQRLVSSNDNSLYELTTGAPVLPTAIYTHPNTAWRWTSISETSTAIYASGYAGSSSAIYKFVLATNGTMPTLSQGVIAAQLPVGEVVHCVYGYLGVYLAIGTSKGIRVAIANDTGDLQYGPLIVETTQPVHSIAARDRFLWFSWGSGIDSASGTGRIDLGMDLGNLRFAYAADLYDSTAAGAVKALSFLGNSDLLSFSDNTKIWVEHPTEKLSQGYVKTSRIRFSTLEPKLYKLLRVRGPILKGSLAISSINDQGVEVSLTSIAQDSQPGAEDVQINTPTSAQEWLALKFTLNRNSSDATLGAVMNGYQLKALPGTPRKRMITVPLMCYDHENDHNGQSAGKDGYAYERILSLETLEDTGDTVLFQDLNANRSEMVTIENIRFVQVSPPKKNDSFGGILFVSMRTT